MSDEKTARAVAKLHAALNAGDHYAALQLYRTLIKRKIDAGALDEAESMLVDGAATLLRAGRTLEGKDLMDMLIKALYVAHKLPLTQKAVHSIETIADAIPQSAIASRIDVLATGVRWAKDATVDPTPVRATPSSGDSATETLAIQGGSRSAARPTTQELRHHDLIAALHAATARAAVAAGPAYIAEAQRHFLEADAPEDFAHFLLSLSRSGYVEERDLFLSRAVMQLLCLGNLRDANRLRDAFLLNAEASFSETEMKKLDTPLSHFVRFLLLTLERDARPLFEALVDKYRSALKRDPDFKAYVASIGHRFFGIIPPQSGSAAMMNSLMAMLGGGGSPNPGGISAGSVGPRLPFPFPFGFPPAAT